MIKILKIIHETSMNYNKLHTNLILVSDLSKLVQYLY